MGWLVSWWWDGWYHWSGCAVVEEVVSEMDNNDDEEAWLDALEAGEVNERGYLPQKVDVSTLTARQVTTIEA